tara:strand:+ start:52046 stop:52867 length:822 start_codon:yes stop_codon:yes gene_type:complete
MKAREKEKQALDELHAYYADAIIGHNRPMTWLNNFEGIFRSRVISASEIPTINSVSSIWYRDQSFLDFESQTIGRCHFYGESLFYGSNSLEATVHELNPKDGDFLLVGDFAPKKDAEIATCQFAGIPLLRQNPNFRELMSKYEFPTSRDEQIEKQITTFFTKRADSETLEEYLHTIAFTKILLHGENMDAIAYPSVGSKLRLINFGLKAEYVDKNLFCRAVSLFKVKKHEHKYHLDLLRVGVVEQNRNRPKDSIIKWKFIWDDSSRSELSFSF